MKPCYNSSSIVLIISYTNEIISNTFTSHSDSRANGERRLTPVFNKFENYPFIIHDVLLALTRPCAVLLALSFD